MMRVIEDLAGDWWRLDERIEGLSADITSLVDADPACARLMTVPGIGPIISSAMVAAIGTGEVFSKGRDFAAWLGLVPRQISTRDRTILGKISKRGNRYLRVLFVQAWDCTDQAEELGPARPQAVARGGQEAAASQRPRHRACQQARPHCLERPGPWSNVRGEQDSGRVIIQRENPLTCRGLREDKRNGGSVFPGACEHW